MTDQEQTRQRVGALGIAVLTAVDRLAAKQGFTNEQTAHGVAWAAIDLAERDLGAAGVVEWMRDIADRLERGLLDDARTVSIQ